MLALLWVGLGSAAGGAARYAVSGAVARRIGEVFPWGTLVVNVSGSLLIGLLAALVAPTGAMPRDATVGLLLMTGFCGGYTTFSSFSLQTLNLARDGEQRRALAYVAASVALCLAATAGGFAAGAAVFGG